MNGPFWSGSRPRDIRLTEPAFRNILDHVRSIFRPDRVVIGGSAAQYLDLFSAAMARGL